MASSKAPKAVAETASAKNSRCAYPVFCLNQTKRWMAPSARLAAHIPIQTVSTQFIAPMIGPLTDQAANVRACRVAGIRVPKKTAPAGFRGHHSYLIDSNK
jgi:hypothetical protein